MLARRPLALSGLVCLVALSVAYPAVARAQKVAKPPTPPPVAAGSWAAEIQGMAAAMTPPDQACVERCWILDALVLRGSATGKLDFELRGSVLASGAQDVPLFGTPQQVTIEDAKVNGAPATIGFEGDHYYLHTAERRFTLTGRLSLSEDRALAVPGPLNRLEADLKDGRLTEGDRLSGVQGVTLHFDAERTERAPDPTVFQLSRAVRVARDTTFEYRLTMRSGTDLGVVRLPLKYGERVLDVQGSVGWKVEGEDLVLPTAGKGAEITVTGTLSKLGSFTPDPRSPSEWWLLESDAEHRVSIGGDAKQYDVGSSPIARTQPTSHVFLLQRGQHLDVGSQTLSSLDVLAATVRDHKRRVVITAGGELIAQDDLSYENRGVDEIGWLPDGKATFLSTDGRPERLLHKEGSSEVSLPLQMGAHSVRVQTVREQRLGWLAGFTTVDVPTLPLTATRTELDLGLPAGITPALATGGDAPYVPLGAGDGIAAGIAAIAAMIVLRDWRSRALGAAALAGLWFVYAPAFVVLVGALILGGAGWVLARLLRGKKRAGLLAALGTAALAIGGLLMFTRAAERHTAYPSYYGPTTVSAARDESVQLDDITKLAETKAAPMGGVAGQAAAPPVVIPAMGGFVNGVSSVELTLPSPARNVSLSRELVTPGHPMKVTLFYVTSAGLWAMFLGWLALVAMLARRHASALRALHARFQEKLAASEPKPEEKPAVTPTPAEQPAE